MVNFKLGNEMSRSEVMNMTQTLDKEKYESATGTEPNITSRTPGVRSTTELRELMESKLM